MEREWLMNLDTLMQRRCTDCGHQYRDDGGVLCPECGSSETEFVEERHE